MALPAAGLPWFMTVFGRDSLLTSYQALPFAPELAETTLRVLAARQATQVDDFRDAEPGKILHEIRLRRADRVRGAAALAVLRQRRRHAALPGPPRRVRALDGRRRRSSRELETEARAALAWIDELRRPRRRRLRRVRAPEHRDRAREPVLEGLVELDRLRRRHAREGRRSRPARSRATCTTPRRAPPRLARDVWDDPALAHRLEEQAAALKQAVQRRLLAGRARVLRARARRREAAGRQHHLQHRAPALERDRRRRQGGRRRAPPARRPELFSGWGVRTMAAGEGGYNPLGYHTGTVWPHDNSLIAAGLARYGFREEAARIAIALLEAAEFFRLPAAGGLRRLPPRRARCFPVEYPTACSPQAWATRRAAPARRRRCSGSGPSARRCQPTRCSRPGSGGSRCGRAPPERARGRRRSRARHRSGGRQRRCHPAGHPHVRAGALRELRRLPRPGPDGRRARHLPFRRRGRGSWHVTIDDGASPGREPEDAHCVIRSRRASARLATGAGRTPRPPTSRARCRSRATSRSRGSLRSSGPSAWTDAERRASSHPSASRSELPQATVRRRLRQRRPRPSAPAREPTARGSPSRSSASLPQRPGDSRSSPPVRASRSDRAELRLRRPARADEVRVIGVRESVRACELVAPHAPPAPRARGRARSRRRRARCRGSAAAPFAYAAACRSRSTTASWTPPPRRPRREARRPRRPRSESRGAARAGRSATRRRGARRGDRRVGSSCARPPAAAAWPAAPDRGRDHARLVQHLEPARRPPRRGAGSGCRDRTRAAGTCGCPPDLERAQQRERAASDSRPGQVEQRGDVAAAVEAERPRRVEQRRQLREAVALAGGRDRGELVAELLRERRSPRSASSRRL